MTATPRHTPPAPRRLIPLTETADLDPIGWADAVSRGRGAVPVISTDEEPDEAWCAGLARLVAAGTTPLVRISLGYATRPVPEVADEIKRWADTPALGVFFDHAPSGPYQIGPVAHAVRTARRLIGEMIVLNPGTDVDPIYRDLPAILATFEGTWGQYLSRRTHAGGGMGDAHLVFGVPRDDLPVARALVLARWASLFLVTDRASAFAQTTAARR